MVAAQVACPQCRVVLQSPTPIPVGMRISCPSCRLVFDVTPHNLLAPQAVSPIQAAAPPPLPSVYPPPQGLPLAQPQFYPDAGAGSQPPVLPGAKAVRLGLIPIVIIGALRQPSMTSASGNTGGRVIPFSQINELGLPLGPFSVGVFDVKS